MYHCQRKYNYLNAWERIWPIRKNEGVSLAVISSKRELVKGMRLLRDFLRLNAMVQISVRFSQPWTLDRCSAQVLCCVVLSENNV